MNKNQDQITFSTDEVLALLEDKRDIRVFSGIMSFKGQGHNYHKTRADEAQQGDRFDVEEGKSENTFLITRNGKKFCYVSSFQKEEFGFYYRKYGKPDIKFKNTFQQLNFFEAYFNISWDEAATNKLNKKLQIAKCCIVPGRIMKVGVTCADDLCKKEGFYYYCHACETCYPKEEMKDYESLLKLSTVEKKIDYCPKHGHELCQGLEELLSQESKVGSKRKGEPLEQIKPNPKPAQPNGKILPSESNASDANGAKI